jgi:hypothetical protein
MGYVSTHVNVTIADAGTLSGAGDIMGKTVTGMIIPAGFEGTSVKFHVSMNNTDYYILTDPDDGNDVAVVAAASEAYAIDPALLSAWNFVKVLAASQTGAIVITLLCEEGR